MLGFVEATRVCDAHIIITIYLDLIELHVYTNALQDHEYRILLYYYATATTATATTTATTPTPNNDNNNNNNNDIIINNDSKPVLDSAPESRRRAGARAWLL